MEFYDWLLTNGITAQTALNYSSRVKFFVSLNIPFDEFVVMEKNKGCTNNTLNAYVKSLRQFGKYIDNTELQHLKYFKKNESNISTLSDSEIELFLEREAFKWPYFVFFSILAYTGMRPIEVNNLRLTDFNFSTNSIRIFATKTQTIRTIPIPLPIIPILAEYCNEVEDYLYPTKISAQVMYYHFHTRLRQLGIKRGGLHVYSLRHSYATRMIDAEGVDPFSVKNLMGHKDLSMTERYYHLSAKKLQRVAAKDPLGSSNVSVEEKLRRLKDELVRLCEGFAYSIDFSPDSITLKIRGSPPTKKGCPTPQADTFKR